MTIRDYIKVVMQGAKGYIDNKIVKATATASDSTIILTGIAELYEGMIVSFTLPSDVNAPVITINNNTYAVNDINNMALDSMTGGVGYLLVYAQGAFFMAGGGSGVGGNSAAMRYKETIYPTENGQLTFTLANAYTMNANCLDVVVDGIPQPAGAITEINAKTFKLDDGFEITTSTQIDVTYYRALDIADPDTLAVRYKETFFPTAGQYDFTLANKYAVGGNCLDVYVNGIAQPNTAFIETSENSFTLHDSFEIVEGTQIDVVYMNALEITNAVTYDHLNAVQTHIDDVDSKITTLEGDVAEKSNKSIYVEAIMSASIWSSNIYSFETTYPHSRYDIDISLGACTKEQFEAFGGAMIVGSLTSNIVTAIGDVPTVDIPIIIKVVAK